MKGYLKNERATQASFHGGWFHTGDLGVRMPDGYIRIRDRSKDIIISGGENISSIEVEDTLYRHPAVSVAAVVAMADPKWGEDPARSSSSRKALRRAPKRSSRTAGCFLRDSNCQRRCASANCRRHRRGKSRSSNCACELRRKALNRPRAMCGAPYGARRLAAGGGRLRLAARIDPAAGPACRVLQGLFFAGEVIERIELVARFGARGVACSSSRFDEKLPSGKRCAEGWTA